VLDNVAYGPRSRRIGKADSRAIALACLARAGMERLSDRKPQELSGGERQRVAIARLMASAPHTILLDEPMASLDLAAAAEIRQLLLDNWPADAFGIVATHSPLDLLSLATRVICLEAGRVVADQPVARALAEPQSPFTARMVGLNLLSYDKKTWLAFPPNAATVQAAEPAGSADGEERGEGAIVLHGQVTAAQADTNGSTLLVKTPSSEHPIIVKMELLQISSFPPGAPISVTIDTKLSRAYAKER
jgi:ABC-type sulfate/molybdate transport systems ATPase subunit